MGNSRAIHRAVRRPIIDNGGDDSSDVYIDNYMGNIWAIIEPS
jgi:hypothetical protein